MYENHTKVVLREDSCIGPAAERVQRRGEGRGVDGGVGVSQGHRLPPRTEVCSTAPGIDSFIQLDSFSGVYKVPFFMYLYYQLQDLGMYIKL